jgi:CheY-like chemotaxis protein
MLFVTDSPEDKALFRDALAQTGVRMNLEVFSSVQETVAFLKADPPFEKARALPRPNVIVIDFLQSRTGVSELLLWLQNNPNYKLLGKVVLTASSDPEEIATAYSLGANAVVARPSTSDERMELFRAVCNFWSLSERPIQTGS